MTEFSRSKNFNFRAEGLGCARFYLENLGNDKEFSIENKYLEMDRAMDIDGVFKKCYQSCDFQSEKIMVTTADYPSRNNFENRNGMCLVIKKLDIICQNEIKFKIFEEFYITHPTYPKSGSFCALVKSQIDGEICEHNFTTSAMANVLKQWALSQRIAA